MPVRRPLVRVTALTVLVACTITLLPMTASWADASVRVSAPQYEAPGGTVPVIVTMVDLPSGTTSAAVTARGTNGSTAICDGPVWINGARRSASRTCYLTLPRRSGSYNVRGTVTAYRSGQELATRSGTSGRAILADGPGSAALTLRQMHDVERCHNTTPAVWLTFDDGASAGQLDAILTTLSRNNARGRFFFTGGWRRQNPGLYGRLIRSGHLLANHSLNHPALSRQSDGEVSRQIRLGVPATTTPQLLRPPFGAGALTARLRALAAAEGYRVCRWTVDTFDWDQATPDLMKERVVTGDFRSPPVAAGGNVLMHGTARFTSTGGLQAVIDGIRARGLSVEPLGGAAAPPSQPTTVGTPPPPAPVPPPAPCPNRPESATPTVRVSATASQVTAGGRATVYGYVADADGCAVPGARVSLLHRPYGGTLAPLQDLTTDDRGRFSRVVAPRREALFVAEVRHSRSPAQVLRVASRVLLASPEASARLHNPVVFRGILDPPHAGAHVVLSVWRTDRWVPAVTATTDGSGRWLRRVDLPRGGLTLRASVRAGDGNDYGETIRRVLVG